MEHTPSYQQSETPTLCARGCGFFGSPATHNLCSKCYVDYLKEQVNSMVVCQEDHRVLNVSANPSPCDSEGLESAKVAENDIPSTNKKNRCLCCNKKVGFLGFGCRCGGNFCGVHRYPEMHECKLDYKSVGRMVIAEQNPLVKADKMESRI